MKVGDLVSHTNFPQMIGLIAETKKHSFRGLYTIYSHRVVWFSPKSTRQWALVEGSGTGEWNRFKSIRNQHRCESHFR